MAGRAAFETESPFARDYAPLAVRWTRADCDRLEAAGSLTYSYELIEGIIVRQTGKTLAHGRCATQVFSWFLNRFGVERVLPQPWIYVAADDVPTNRPAPDLLLLNKPVTEIGTNEPRVEDISLIIEVAHTSLDYDLGTKAMLYARAAIPEYWVISVEERCAYVHLHPANGSYVRTRLGETDTIAPSSAPEAALRISEFLTPTASMAMEAITPG